MGRKGEVMKQRGNEVTKKPRSAAFRLGRWALFGVGTPPHALRKNVNLKEMHAKNV